MPYPDKINALVDIAGTSTLAAVGHAARHNDLNDAFDELAVVLTVPAANTLALAPGGTERLRINSSGNVGIGTSSPAGTLHVDGGLSITQRYANSGAFLLRRANGSAGTPTAVAAADSVALIIARAYDGTSTYRDVGSLSFSASQNTSPTQSGGYFSIATTADGATSTTERMRIDNAGLITGTGTSLGAWTAYTPTFNGVTLGNGTASGYYAVIGKLLFMRAELILGSTSSVTGDMRVTLPSGYTMRNAAIGANVFHGYAVDVSAGVVYGMSAIQYDADEFTLRVPGTNGLLSTVSATNPITWAPGDIIRFAALVEIA